MTKTNTAIFSFAIVCALAEAALGQASLPNAAAVDEAMRRANDYWVANNGLGNSGWARGAYNTGNHRAFRVLGERAYHNRAVSWGDANLWLIGPEGPGSADAYTCGQTYIDLYRLDLRSVYLADIKAKTDALVASPAVDGWWWIDAFYMQGPVLARLGNLTGNTNYYAKLWSMYDDMKTRVGLFDPAESLWYRDATYTNALTANGQKVFWSRGNGWMFAGLARVLQQMSTNAPHYYDYVMMFTNMAPALKAIQGADGMWRSSLYDYNEYPNPETSGTGFFTYGMAWGIRNGLLPAADYTNTIALAWQGLTNLALQASGRVGWVQNVGVAPASTTADTTTDFGVGAFLLACSEIYLMAPDAPAIRPWAGPDQSLVTTNGTVTVSLDASQTEIYKGTAVSYSWWEGMTNFASGITASTNLALGTHIITLKVLGSDSVTYTDSMSVAVITPPSTASGSWNSDSDGLWSDSAKWLNATVANGATNTADFSLLDITGDRTVTLDIPRTIGVLKFGDTSGTQNWIIASVTNALTLDGSNTAPSIVVNINAATIGASLAGTNGFVKSGPGTLILPASNSITGVLNLDRGIDGNNDDGATRIAHPDAIRNVSSVNIRNSSVTTAGGATLQLDGSAGSIVITQTFTTSCRNNSTRATLQNVAGTNTLTGFMALSTGGSNFNIQSDSGLLVLSGTNQYIGSLVGPRNYLFSGSGDVLLNGPILSAAFNTSGVSVIKSGAGTLRLMATNTYRNGTTVNGGALLVGGWVTGAVTVANSGVLGGAGAIRGTVTVQSSGVLAPGDGIGTLTISNLVLNAGAVLQYELGSNSDLTAVSSNLTLAGTLNINNAGGFGAGTNVLFTYGKTLVYNGLNVGTAPWGYNYSINTGTIGQVKLVVTSATTAWQQWQFQYFGCTNCPQSQPNADPLGKGISNTNQFLLGLNPTNSASLFRIISATTQGNNLVVTWQTAGGRTNVLQAVSGSYSNNFVDLSGSTTVVAGSGDTATNYTDVGAATNSPARFYRIRLVP